MERNRRPREACADGRSWLPLLFAATIISWRSSGRASSWSTHEMTGNHKFSGSPLSVNSKKASEKSKTSASLFQASGAEEAVESFLSFSRASVAGRLHEAVGMVGSRFGSSSSIIVVCFRMMEGGEIITLRCSSNWVSPD